jgi:hypothetical protein
MDDDCGEDSAEIGAGELVVAGSDPAPLFEPAEAALDGVALPIQLRVEHRRPTTGRPFGPGHRFAADVWDVVDLDEHPEFKAAYDELTTVACAMCGTPTDFGTPLLLVGLLPDLPLVAVDGWAADDRKGRERVAQVLGVPVAPPPNWVVTTTRRLFPVLLAATGSEELRQRVDAADGPEPFAAACRALGRALGALAAARAMIFAMTALGNRPDLR